MMHCELIAQGASSAEQTLQSSLQHARNQGDMTLADSLAAELLELAKKNADPSLQAEAFYELARNSMERNKYDESAELLNQSIELFQSVGERKRLGDAYRQLGLTFRYQSNYSTALEYIYLAMQIYQDIGDKQAISSTYNSIGIVMEKMGQ
jgi:two-component system cell cycle response regulator